MGLLLRSQFPGVDARTLSVRRCRLTGMARFEDQDLTGAEFRECDLTRARLIGVVMQDAVIDGLVSNLVVNGVEVTSYVEAELDRRYPVRPLMRSTDPADLGRPSGSCGPPGRRRSPASAGSPRVGAPARRRRVVGGGDASSSGLRARLVVPPLLPGIDRAVHRNRAWHRTSSLTRKSRAWTDRRTQPRPGVDGA